MKSVNFFYAAVLVVASSCCFAQEAAFHGTSGTVKSASADDLPDAPARASSFKLKNAATLSTRGAASNGTTSTVPTWQSKVDRWVDVRSLEFSMRYRNTADSNGYHLFEFGQQRSLVDGAFKLDAESRYTVNVHASSGKYFNWAYSDVWGGSFGNNANNSLAFLTPAELEAAGAAIAHDPFFGVVQAHLGSRGWGMSVRQLYFGATPIKQVTGEFGSFGIERGVNTEMTTYDDDGYMTGERIRVHDPGHLFFNEVSYTNGYLGDIYFPNIVDRGERFKESNYQQFLVAKKFGTRVETSMDFTRHVGTSTVREGVKVRAKETHFVDSVRVELYQRLNAVTLQTAVFAGGSGFGVTGEKEILKRLKFEGGYAQIDKNYPVYTGSSFMVAVGHPMNGDQYAIGKRGFARGTVHISPNWTLFGYYSHAFDTPFLTLFNQGFTAGANYQVAELFHHKNAISH